jgi:ligand-binding sensor domain-containing protein
MRQHVHRCALWLFVLLCSSQAVAATGAPELPIERLPVNGALTQNSVTDMLQDRSGLMWFATLGGVNTYDGYRFRAISSDPRDPDSLSGVMVARLFEDRDGAIWVGGFLGWLDRIDPRTGKVTHLPRSLFGRTDRPPAFATLALWQDAQGLIWIGTGDGLHRYDPRSGKLTLHVDALGKRPLLASIRDLVPASGGRIWIAGGEGLYLFDPRTRALQHFGKVEGDARSLPSDSLTRLYNDRDGTLWIGTGEGLAHR